MQLQDLFVKKLYLPINNMLLIILGAPQSLYGGRRLTALIGLSRALDLLITGRPISGVDANAMGLACKLTSTGTGEVITLVLLSWNICMYVFVCVCNMLLLHAAILNRLE